MTLFLTKFGWWRAGRGLAFAAFAALLYGCSSVPPTSTSRPGTPPSTVATPPSGAGRMQPVSWSQVDGWQDDSLIGARLALAQSCVKLGRQTNWQPACRASERIDDLDPAAVRQFFEQYFTPFRIANADGTQTGLITGYYEPLLHGSRVRGGVYQTPLYKWPTGRRAGSLPARAELMRSGILRGHELVYVDDPVEAFFLQVQGSGQVLLDDGTIMRVGYAGNNDQPYKSIGRWLIDHGEITPAQATMQGIRAWARANPSRVDALLDVNPRFVFFREMPNHGVGGIEGPVGALGVPLTAERSIAVDPASIPLGSPVFLATTRPPFGAQANTPINRLMFAQDTGSAIKGGVRADFFWGLGDDAGDLAGRMRQSGRMWVFLPNQ
ncbi:murein transglycosylase A [Pandoraea cepalis]|uniref:murein transglycosylase A n=1 Tax=Pandoraea cepalis TaxID=2508294 RepID=UPI0020C4593C|nr:MltA domain-containing protein [Pandoraea cepalis]